jgi:hypothetical protein
LIKKSTGRNTFVNWDSAAFGMALDVLRKMVGYMFIVPVPFSVEGAKMLQHTKWLLDERDEADGCSSLIAIHPSFDKLLTALRTAVANEYRLDKTETSYDDILDAFRLSLIFYKRAKE